MAFVDPTQADEEANQQNPSQADEALNPSSSQDSGDAQGPVATELPSTSAGGAGVVSGGSAPSASQAGPVKPSSSGSWTNLESYLSANADQGTNVGNQIAQTVEKAGTNAQNDVTNLGVNFKSAVDQNTINQDPDAISGAIGAATSATAGKGLTQDQIDAYNKQANASYSGPTDPTAFDGYTKAQQTVNEAQQKALQTKSESGRDVLLNNQYQNASVNGYTQGENNLDQLLLQNSSGGQAALQPLADKWGSLTGALSNTVAGGTEAATNARATSDATAAAAKGALGTAETNFEKQLNDGMAALKAKNTSAYNTILADLKSGNLTPQELATLGITADPNYGVDRAANLTQGKPVTLGNYATADQYAQAQALAQLAGQTSSSFLGPDDTVNPQAGTAATSPAFSFNAEKYKSDVAANRATYNQSGADIARRLSSTPFSSLTQNFSVDFGSDLNSAVDKLYGIISGSFRLPVTDQAGLKNWATQQLNSINQLQEKYSLPAFPVSGPTK